MQLLNSRTYPFIDCQSLEERQACDTLFRVGDDEFLLHMSSGDGTEDDARFVWLDCRAVLLWINETPEEFGSEWQ